MEPTDVKYPLELVEADLSNNWVEAVRGCTYVYHVASPFPGSGSNLTLEQQQEMIIKPAVDGTLSVLRACAEVGGIKRVVITSSIAAVSSGIHGIPGKPADYVYTEDDWSDESSCSPYEVSKKRAEEAAWGFIEKLDEDKKFELAVVNPAYVQGPLLSIVSSGGTQMLCSMLLSGKLPAIPDLSFPVVDVRDVVSLHMAVMESPEGAGKRFLAYSETVAFKEVAAILRDEFKPQGYSIPSMSLPKIGMWVLKFFDKTAKDTYRVWGTKLAFNNERMKSMGVEPRKAHETILDTAYSLIELGLIEMKPRYRNPSISSEAAEGGGEPQGEEPQEQNEVLAVAVKEPANTDNSEEVVKEPVEIMEENTNSLMSAEVRLEAAKEQDKTTISADAENNPELADDLTEEKEPPKTKDAPEESQK